MPLMTLVLVALNVAAYLLELASGGQAACEAWGLVPAHVVPGHLFSYLFLHDPGTVAHLAGNLVFLAIFGALVEREIGGAKFLTLYFLAGAAGGVLHIAVASGATDPLVGCSGAVFGLLAVAGAIRPRMMGFVGTFGAINVAHAFGAPGAGNVSFAAHLGGLFAGFVFALVLRAAGDEALEAA